MIHKMTFLGLDDRNRMQWRRQVVHSATPIDASADLLAVLKRIVKSYPGYIPDFVEAANAAIAKAEGKTATSNVGATLDHD